MLDRLCVAFVSALALGAPCSAVHAQTAGGHRLDAGPLSLRLVSAPQPAAQPDPPTPEPDDDAIEEQALRLRYADAGTQWLTLGGAVADDFAGSTDVNLHAAWSRFLVDEVELSVELAAWYFDQSGPDAFGVNPNLVFRWHLFRAETWTVYHDAGIGVLLASDTVPDGGTNFDFMPRLGVGLTYGLDDDTRLQLGLRWHHISNARIHGDGSNPARDGLLLYVGVIRRF